MSGSTLVKGHLAVHYLGKLYYNHSYSNGSLIDSYLGIMISNNLKK